MYEFFDTMFGYLEAIGTWIIGFFDMLFTAIDALEVMVTLPVFLMGVLPSILASAVTLTMLLWLVKFFLGR